MEGHLLVKLGQRKEIKTIVSPVDYAKTHKSVIVMYVKDVEGGEGKGNIEPVIMCKIVN